MPKYGGSKVMEQSLIKMKKLGNHKGLIGKGLGIGVAAMGIGFGMTKGIQKMMHHSKMSEMEKLRAQEKHLEENLISLKDKIQELESLQYEEEKV